MSGFEKEGDPSGSSIEYTGGVRTDIENIREAYGWDSEVVTDDILDAAMSRCSDPLGGSLVQELETIDHLVNRGLGHLLGKPDLLLEALANMAGTAEYLLDEKYSKDEE